MNTAHILIDYQNDFVNPGAPLYVQGAESLAPAINRLISKLVDKNIKTIFTKDSHPAGMDSFASTHRYTPFTERESIIPTLAKDYYWPDHCIQGTPGECLYYGLLSELCGNNTLATIIKWNNQERELYSAFKGTNLDELLKDNNIKTLLISWVATERCVQETALDGVNLGYKVIILEDTIKEINKEAKEECFKLLKENNVQFSNTNSWEEHIILE